MRDYLITRIVVGLVSIMTGLTPTILMVLVITMMLTPSWNRLSKTQGTNTCHPHFVG
jgi:hypothetical protein